MNEQLLDLFRGQILKVMFQGLLLNLKQTHNLLNIPDLKRLLLLLIGPALKLEDPPNLINGIITRQQGPPRIQLINQAPQTPHITLIPILLTTE